MEPLFSCGSELANLVVASDFLHKSWAAIRNLETETNPNEQQQSLAFSVKYKVYYPQQPSKHIIVAFITSPTCTKQHLQEESSSTLEENHPLFEFLCTGESQSFSIHKAALTLFASVHEELSLLKNQLCSSSPLIITGHSLGGSIASLFTLWLLESIHPKTAKRPLCVTFGSPLIGDRGLQNSISEYSTWNSCFLHVASDKDPIPRLFLSPHTPGDFCYRPFGTFLLCSEFGCASFEDSDSILDMLVATSQNPTQGFQAIDYWYVLEHLKKRILIRGISTVGEQNTNPLRAGILTQLEETGITRSQNLDTNTLIGKMEEREVSCVTQKREVFDPYKKLGDMKINMVRLEWYKKASTAQNIGYYDSYKNKRFQRDLEISLHKKKLTKYWEKLVAEAEKKPQKEGAAFHTRWLYAGTNYRRMVEPLDIADFYDKNGSKDYITEGRSKHYILLEQWQKDDEKPSDHQNIGKERKLACSLTEDSCFWAHVENAIISCNSLKRGDCGDGEKSLLWEKLIEFEGYVMGLIKDLAVYPEVFCDRSRLMEWWREYEKIIGVSYDSEFVNFMKNYDFKRYA